MIGTEATKLYRDAVELLDIIIENQSLQSKAVLGFFPANSRMDDVVIFEEDNDFPKNVESDSENQPKSKKIKDVLHFLRQQSKKAPNLPNYCLSDFIRPDNGKERVLRGGSFVDFGMRTKCAYRDSKSPEHSDKRVGFRCCKTP